MKTSKEVALTVAGIVALLTTGQSVVQAASNIKADTKQADATLTVSINDMVAASDSSKKISFADQNIRVSSNKSVTSDAIADATKSNADKAAEKAAAAAKATAADEEAAQEKKDADKKAEEKAAKEAEEKAAKQEAVQEERAAEQIMVRAEKAVQSSPAASGSVYDQFIAAGGTASMWHAIVMPESGGNPNAVSAAGYRGLGQTKEGWGAGSVATQTRGMVGYATSRYGSVEGALKFRAAHGWW